MSDLMKSSYTLGEEILDRSTNWGKANEPFYRVTITPDGTVLVGDGFSPPAPLSGGGGAHPDLAGHDALGLATQDELEAHALTSHGSEHPDVAAHDALGLATQDDLDAHAATSHGAPSTLAVVAEVIVGAGGAATIDFQNIPATYRHLRFLFSGRLEGGAAQVTTMLFRFNNDSSAVYDHSKIVQNGTALTGAGLAGQSAGQLSIIDNGGQFADSFSQVDMTIFDYANTLAHKVASSLGASYYNFGTGEQNEKRTARWRSTAAIDRLTLIPPSPFKAGTTATLYGIKGA